MWSGQNFFCRENSIKGDSIIWHAATSFHGEMRNILTWRPLIYSSAEWNPTKSFVSCWIKIFESCHKKKLPRCLINLSVCMPSSFNSLLASGDFCCLLITFENSLDPDKARHFVGPDLDPTCLTLWWYSWKNFVFENLNFQKKSTDYKKACKITQHATS